MERRVAWRGLLLLGLAMPCIALAGLALDLASNLVDLICFASVYSVPSNGTWGRFTLPQFKFLFWVFAL